MRSLIAVTRLSIKLSEKSNGREIYADMRTENGFPEKKEKKTTTNGSTDSK